ncbi:LysM peptidoglycan-binding domain-containing protein [bacterium]|nr:LysM peptidoglycan-binding domain-containing protein [bacterium]
MISQFPPVRQRPLLFLPLLVALAVSGGCAVLKPDPNPAPAAADSDPESSVGVAITDLDSVPELILPADTTAPLLPLGPDGYAGLADLEAMLATAMELGAEGAWDEAEDHLFVLRDEARRPAPAQADSTWLAHRRSIDRRVGLLRAVLAEQAAFGADPADADSLLSTGYGVLLAEGFPDSLVPASGARLSSITADLMKFDNKAVRRWEEYFTGRGRRSFQTWLDRKAEVGPLIEGILVEEGLPRELVYLAMIESGFSTRAVSSASAVGPWQFMAPTARDYGLRASWWVDERRDLEMSTRAAARYIGNLHEQFGDWALVLAAYNTGGGRIARKIRQHGHDNFWDLRLPAQTTAHIPKFIAAARLGADPARYGFTVPDGPVLDYDTVPVDDATDLALIARCAGVGTDDVLSLNPALLRGASPPDLKAYPVRVPSGTGPRARRELARVPSDKRLTWRRHEVRRGDTLGGIARSYGTTVGDIARLNKLKDVHMIRPGDQLLIPMPAELATKAQQRASEKGHYVPPSGYERVSYKVRPGDTLGGIARKLGVTLAHLRKVNNIHQTNLIRPGQRLYAYRPPSG